MMTRYCTQPIPEHGNMGVCGLRVDATGRCPDADAPTHQVKPTAQTHDFWPYAGGVCRLLVERPDGRHEECGEPVKSPVHDPAAYLAYAEELRVELRKWQTPGVSLEDLVVEYGDVRRNLAIAYREVAALGFIDASAEKYTAIVLRIGEIRRLCAEQMSRPGHPSTRRIDAAQILRILDGGE